jgi:hypothetical protein
MNERTYSTITGVRLALNALIPALVVVVLVLAHTVMSNGPPPLWWSAFIGAFGLFYGARTALVAHTVRIGADGRVEFRRLLGAVSVAPTEVRCVRRSVMRPWLSVVSSRGRVLLPNAWKGLAEVVEYLRNGNPGLDLDRM